MIVHNNDYYFRWKLPGLPSTFGRQPSFVDALVSGDEAVLTLDPELPPLVVDKIMEFGYKEADWAASRAELLENFTKDQEYGLLNRLDTVTQGRLYFARSHDAYQRYQELQDNQNIHKQYIAYVAGDCSWIFKKPQHGVTVLDATRFMIDLPIMHHRHLDERMVVLTDWDEENQSSNLLTKGRGDPQSAVTRCELIKQEATNTWLRVTISQGVRHQIRAHLGAVGYPVVGEPLYADEESEEALHLWSIGLVQDR